MLVLPAYAKLNLTLEVLGRRQDGYHDLASIFQTIDLADTLAFAPGDELAVDCDVPDLLGPQNSALAAARLLREQTGYQGGASIRLQKAIPVGAGLGGHSADGAAALEGLNRLWCLELDRRRLLELAAMLSSDTPFFLYGGTALVQGRGERVTPLPPLPQTWLVLLSPPIGPLVNKTAKLYAALTPSRFTSGERTRKLAEIISQGRSIDRSLLCNVFEAVAFDIFPDLSRYRAQMLEAGASSVHLAGSGPSLFTVVPDRASGEAIRGRLDSQGQRAYLVRTISPGPEE